MDEAERLRERLDAELGDYWDMPYILLGMIPNATRRLATELRSGSLQDSCAALHAARVFNDSMAALMMIQRGMLVPAHQLVRHCLESTAQAILFLEAQDVAEAWMSGKRFTPGEVRKRLGETGAALRPLYDSLSDIAHVTPRRNGTKPFRSRSGRGPRSSTGAAISRKS